MYSQHHSAATNFFFVKAHTTHRQSASIYGLNKNCDQRYTQEICFVVVRWIKKVFFDSFLLVYARLKNEKPLHESNSTESVGKVSSKAIYLLWSRYIPFIERFDEKLAVVVELPIVWLCVHQALVQKQKMKNFELIRRLLIGIYFIQGKF